MNVVYVLLKSVSSNFHLSVSRRKLCFSNRQDYNLSVILALILLLLLLTVVFSRTKYNLNRLVFRQKERKGSVLRLISDPVQFISDLLLSVEYRDFNSSDHLQIDVLCIDCCCFRIISDYEYCNYRSGIRNVIRNKIDYYCKMNVYYVTTCLLLLYYYPYQYYRHRCLKYFQLQLIVYNIELFVIWSN